MSYLIRLVDQLHSKSNTNTDTKKIFSNYFLGQQTDNQSDITRSKQAMGATDWFSIRMKGPILGSLGTLCTK
jgi:hypothetical protein